MLFNSYIFVVFLAVILPLYYITPSKYKNIFLLITSYIFYGYWDWRFCMLIALSTFVDYFMGILIDGTSAEKKRKMFLIISMVTNLTILGFFKYFNFFVDSFEEILSGFGLKLDYVHLNIILPVGVSFYTFQSMSYTIDIYRKRLKATNSFLDFAVFVAFFPQLVAGPIERAVNLLPQVSRKIKPLPTREQFEKGLILVATGMFRKVMIGDTAGRMVDHIFTQPDYYLSGELLAALILFSIQIYADFSGYSSIARGVAKLLGFELLKNFEQPYLSRNITEFWRRWHISLSSWLKDYLYITLGGNRKGNTRTYVNLMITMLLGGLWHGASWNFVIWGALHGIYLAIHKMILGNKKVSEHYSYSGPVSFLKFIGSILLTNVLVIFTWLFFRAKTFGDAMYFLNKIIHWEQSELTAKIMTISLSFVAITFLWDIFEYYTKKHTFLLKIKSAPLRYGILAAFMFVVLVYMYQAKPMPFIYFQF